MENAVAEDNKKDAKGGGRHPRGIRGGPEIGCDVEYSRQTLLRGDHTARRAHLERKRASGCRISWSISGIGGKDSGDRYAR